MNKGIVERIKLSRLINNMSQKDLGLLVNKNQQQVAKLENGLIKNIDILKYSRALNVPIEWLAEARNPPDYFYLYAGMDGSYTISEITMAIHSTLEKLISHNPKISDSAKIELVFNTPISLISKTIKESLLEQVNLRDK